MLLFELGVLAKKRLGEASGQSTQAVVSSKLIEVAKEPRRRQAATLVESGAFGRWRRSERGPPSWSLAWAGAWDAWALSMAGEGMGKRLRVDPVLSEISQKRRSPFLCGARALNFCKPRIDLYPRVIFENLTPPVESLPRLFQAK